MTENKHPAAGLLRLGATLMMLALLAVTAGVLYAAFRDNPWDRLGADLLAIGPSTICLCLGATGLSYLAMTGYDALALRYVEHRLPYRQFALASFVATAFGNNLGASAVVGAALRARVYSTWRVPGFAVTRIIGFNLVTLSLGAGVLAGTGMLHAPAAAAAALHLPVGLTVTAGAGLLLAVAGYVYWARTGGKSLRWRDWRIDRPTRKLAVGQVVLSTTEWLTMAAALYVLLPEQGRMAFLPFAAAFAIATSAGLASNLPGGIGVFETALIVMIGSTVSTPQLAVSLVAYRLCYFLLPLLLAALLLVAHEVRTAGVRAPVGQHQPGSLIPSVLTPSLLALGVAGAGVMLLVWGDLPGDTAVPDISTLTLSTTGILALVLARGLHRRLHGAWVSTLALLAGVAVVAATHRAFVLTGVAMLLLLLLVPARGAFYRTTALMTDPRRRLGTVALAGAAGVSLWWHHLGGTALDATWWQTAVSGDVGPVAGLGLTLGAGGALIAGRWITSPRCPGPGLSDLAEQEVASSIVARTGGAIAHLAFTGDKRLHFSASLKSFLMYQVEGRSWVVMGDPVGEPDEFADLLWDFVERADRHGGRPVFYSVGDEFADLYRGAGLTLVKLGEEAVVDLAEFSLEGKSRAGLRQRRNKILRAGATTEFVAPQDVALLLPQLREVSDAWLEHRNGREKRFSLGAFDNDYVCRFPVVTVRLDGRIVAFASLWLGGDGKQVQVDLMRRLPDGPRDVMTHLFVEIMLWAKENGYQSFHLGMAPLSGLRTDSTAPFWERIGHLLWKHGEQFYNFKGLRMFKESFDPTWQVRYVAAPGGLGLPTSMLNVATLVGGGFRGMIRG